MAETAHSKFARDILFAVLGALLGAVLDAVLPRAVGYLVGERLANVVGSLTVVAAILFIFCVVSAIYFVGHPDGRKTVAGVFGLCALLVIAAYVGILLWSPWCGTQVLIEVEPEPPGRSQIVVDSQVGIERDIVLEIRAVTYGQGPQAGGGFSCEWTHWGDMTIIASRGCSLLVQTGKDDQEDIVSVTVHQPGCRQAISESFFIYPPQGEE